MNAVEQDTSFAHLYERYYHPVLAFIRKRVPRPELAEDLTQDAFLRVYPHMEALNGEQGERMYLYTVARHLVANYYRNSDRWKDDTQLELQEDGYFARDVAESYSASESVRLALLHLSEQEQALLIQFFLYGITQEELARERQYVTRTLRNHLSRAKQKFIRAYRKEEIAS